MTIFQQASELKRTISLTPEESLVEDLHNQADMLKDSIREDELSERQEQGCEYDDFSWGETHSYQDSEGEINV